MVRADRNYLWCVILKLWRKRASAAFRTATTYPSDIFIELGF